MEKPSTNEDLETVRVISLDKLGMGLSFICAIHCMITPLIMLSIPIYGQVLPSATLGFIGFWLFSSSPLVYGPSFQVIVITEKKWFYFWDYRDSLLLA